MVVRDAISLKPTFGADLSDLSRDLSGDLKLLRRSEVAAISRTESRRNRSNLSSSPCHLANRLALSRLSASFNRGRINELNWAGVSF